MTLLADLCNTVQQPEQIGRGRPRLPLSDMIFASVFKVHVGFSSRRFTTDLRDAFVSGHVNSTPHFNSVSNYMAKPELTDTLKSLITMSSLPLKAVETDFAVDSSGFSTSRFVKWFNKKYGREVDNREWVKVHLMCGTNTKIVTSVDISGWAAHDTTYFVPLLETTAAHFELGNVLADKAYLSRQELQGRRSGWRDAIRSLQVQYRRADKRRGTDMGADVLLFHVQPANLHGALPYALKCRIRLLHDKGQVWRLVALQE